ncbi:conserved hypothetical protein [Streptomyces viridochromogenes DSM 40736]|uniref:Uncharacterized protein n=1 Tax=Streptomyces viridochromogenes (strain DSM 40736 / JCM 4977 / BCRC 1201 / Tue 494) TaxID=591159 RepID=D9X4T8_STRVT|nr:DUF6578 domain-containing protein [Streptomyces viridochromogenes]EFL31676.1 conserved hypothetical protein [Streptomyces viridochromogenes DSM 40736]
MGLWHVFYADWQMECCGTPFSVGDEVSWPLLLLDADEMFGGGWHDQLTKVSGPVEDVGGVRLVREETGLTVALGADPDDDEDRRPLPGDWTRSVGMLSVERHGARWPQVAGRVRAVQVLTQAYAESAPGSRSWEPVAGRRRLRTVERCPKWFTDADAERADGQRRRWRKSGVVVTLEVPGTDSWLSYAVREARGMPQQDPEPGAETKDLPAAALTALLESLSTVTPPPTPTARRRHGRTEGHRR